MNLKRREQFIRWYAWSLKYNDCDPAVWCTNYLHKRYEHNDEERLWFAWLYDKDNLHIATLTLKNLRDLRIKEKGVYSKENANYTEVRQTYGFEILNHTVFMETMIER